MVVSLIKRLLLAAMLVPFAATATLRIENSFPRDSLMSLGSYYYPEQWPEEQWDRDLSNMADIGIGFTHFGEFAWSRMEPQEGQYDFSWLDKAVELAARHGLKVIMCTPTPTPPRWLTDAHPQMMAVKNNGVRLSHGTRQHVSWSDSFYRECVKALVDTLGRHYANNPHVIGWQIDNEPSHYGIIDYSDNAQMAFRRWLKNKYGTIERLNDTWGTAFWSETYDTFDQIRMPNPQELPAKANPHANLDMRRFVADELASFLNMQADILRSHINPRQWITTNVMPLELESDADKFTSLDFPTYTRYMVVGSNNGIGSQGFRIGTPEDISIPNDMYRNSIGKCFGVMELQPGQVNWGEYNPQPLPGAVSLWVWHTFAGGSRFVCNYRFRQPLKGSEQYHHAMMEADGVTPAIGGLEYRKISDALKVLRREADTRACMPSELARRRTAIILDRDNRYELGFQPQTSQWHNLHHLHRYHNALTSFGAPVDIVNSAADLSDYPFVIAPAYELIDSATVDKWEKYVKNGGHLVLTCRTGQKNREAHLWEGPWAAPIRQLAGIDEMFFDHLPPHLMAKVQSGDKTYTWNNWADVISPASDTDVWAVYADQFYSGKAAVVNHKIGRGTVTYIGVDTDDGILERDILQRIFTGHRADVESLPYGVLHLWRDGLDFYLNYTSEKIDIDTLNAPRGRVLCGSRQLPPAGVTIIKR